MFNKNIKKIAEELRIEKFVPMDIYFSKETTFKKESASEKKTGINIGKYNCHNIPVKNAQRPIHKMLTQDELR